MQIMQDKLERCNWFQLQKGVNTVHSRPTTFRNQTLPFGLTLTIVRQNETCYLYFTGFICMPLFDRHLRTLFSNPSFGDLDRYSMTRQMLKKGNKNNSKVGVFWLRLDVLCNLNTYIYFHFCFHMLKCLILISCPHIRVVCYWQKNGKGDNISGQL
jgi:hypothetical protein